jgi:hypothetical protein
LHQKSQFNLFCLFQGVKLGKNDSVFERVMGKDMKKSNRFGGQFESATGGQFKLK